MQSLKIKKGKKYSICTCGQSRKIPFWDNEHRKFNSSNNVEFKSLKIRTDVDSNVNLSCKTWQKKDE